MPHSGYIKRFILDTGYEFYTREDISLNEFLIKHGEDYNPLPIFLLIVIKNNFVMSRLYMRDLAQKPLYGLFQSYIPSFIWSPSNHVFFIEFYLNDLDLNYIYS